MDVQVELHDLRSLSMYNRENEPSVTGLFDQQTGLSLLFVPDWTKQPNPCRPEASRPLGLTLLP